ncbi:MAG TPA: hypothetical protein VN906_08725 [Candidatus Sulfotelmatobacter sp.]|nr:hypothetical protein [Candidatus Sulfotelmatobacter sp.]
MRLALTAVLISILTACGPSLAPSAAVSPADTPTSIASAPRISVSEPPISPPTPPGTNLPAFACADASGGKTGVANTITARVGEQPGYDRFVLQMDSIVPQYTVKRQATAVFTQGASGQTVQLSGSAGILITVKSATGASTFTGPRYFVQADYQVLKEARETQDFEGTVSWGLGLSRSVCMRVFTLNDPARLIVDLQTT